MAWWDFLLSNPSTTAAIPPMLPPQPNFMGPGAYPGAGMLPGGQNPTAGLHEAIYGSPFIPTPFDDKPNTFRPGAQPGQLDVAPKPPIPSAPMMGRQPAPAAMPMPGALPEGANPPGAMGMGDLAFPGAMTPPASPQAAAPTRKPFDWGPDASLWSMLMQAGQGMMQPSYYGFGGQLQQGLAGATEAAQKAPMQKAQRRLLEAQVGEVEAKGDVRKQAAEIAKSLPAGHPARSYFALGLVEKGLEKLTPDWNQLIVVGPDGQPRMNETLVKAKAYIASAGQMKPQYGVTGYDVGGKAIHGWVYPPGMSMPGVPTGAQPAAPSAAPTSGPPGAAPTAAPPSTPGSAPPAAPPVTPTQGREGIPPPPPGADPYKWAEEQTKLRIQKQSMGDARKQQAPVVIQDIDRALERIKGQSDFWPQTGFGGMLTNQIGANQLDKILSGVQANIGFDALNQMRANSPTGGALGQVTERELAFLQSVYGNIRVSTTQKELEFNLRRLKNAMLDVIHGPGQGPAREKLEGAAGSPKTGTTRSGLRYRVE